MCSITVNSTVEQQLSQLQASHDRQMVEKRLVQFAGEASHTTKGALDYVAPMHDMPDALHTIRKIQIGRHRVFYRGHHSHCCYNTVYIKIHKRTGVNDESDTRFQRILIRALAEPPTRELNSTSDAASRSGEE